MSSTSTNSEPVIAVRSDPGGTLALEPDDRVVREGRIARLRRLWNERRFLWRVTLVGMLASALLAFIQPKRYTSTTRLMPPDSQSGSAMALLAGISARTGAGLGLTGLASDFLGLKSSGALFVGILQSRTVQDQLINKFDLRKVHSVRRMEDARKKLSEDTSISEDRKSGIITIQVTDSSPQRAAAMAQAYVEELNRLVNELTTSSAHRERVFLEGQLAEVKQDLESAEKEFSQFASKNAAIDIKEQGKAMVEAAATLQGQLIAAQSELEGLRQIYTDNNVRVRTLSARIAELKQQLQKIGGVDESQPTGKVLEAEPLYPSIRKLPLLGVTYADLYRRTKVEEAVFETLTQEYEFAKVQEAKEIPSVKVLDPANVPEKKSFPPRLTIICLGTFLALASAAVWALGSARWQEIDAQDPGKALAQEVFTTLRTRVHLASENGHRLTAFSERVWGWFRRNHGNANVKQ